MLLLHTKQELKVWLRNQKSKGKTIGFVPTMGALHEGHKSLMSESIAHNNCTVVSVFVNPTQFGPNEDFSRYPRTLQADCELAESVGVDVVFAPAADEMYQSEQKSILFSISGLNQQLCGRSRPGHFEGVLLVVNKLFNIVQPDRAYFGKKDIQQCIIIRTMVQQLDMPVELVFGETIREPDGLALSSRNRYLEENQRKLAPFIYTMLTQTKQQLLNGESVKLTLIGAQHYLESKNFKIDYIELVNESDLQPVSEIIAGKPYILACAAFLGNTRLIDNVIFTA